MKITRKVMKTVEETVEVFCNLCGLSCMSPMGDFYGLIEVPVTGGYESTHLEDGDVHKFSLCERCVSEMIVKFHYPSFQGNFMIPAHESNKEYLDDFDPQKYWDDEIVSLDDLEPDEIVSALNMDDMSSDDDSLISYVDDDEECVNPNIPPKKKEDLN